jgi:hypothetical protein
MLDKVRTWLAAKNAVALYPLQVFSEKPTHWFDNLLEVDPGGYLEFYNQYGYPVPSSVTYLLKEDGV